MIIKVDVNETMPPTEQRIRLQVQQELRYKKMVEASIWKSCDAPPPALLGARSREVLILLTDADGDPIGNTVGYFNHQDGEWVWRLGIYSNTNSKTEEDEIGVSLYQAFLLPDDTLDIDPDFIE